MSEQQRCAAEYVLFTGPMWSGKSTSLIATVDKYQRQGCFVAAFKAASDDRYSATDIVTHTGWKIEATPVRTGADLLRHIVDLPGMPDVIAVDEAFMIDGVADSLIELYRMGCTVVVSSLDLSAHGKPFREIEIMMPWTTKIEKLTAVCAVCKKDARYTWKKGGSDAVIEIGGSETYEPRCMVHHPIVNMHSS